MKRTQPHSGLPIFGRPRARHTRSRRGALLLVVLSVLVLFALIGITYVVSASAFKKGADAFKRRDPNHDDPQKEIDAVALQVLRGPRPGVFSTIQGHDLLGDMYGNQSRRGTITDVDATPGPHDGSAGNPVIREFMKITVSSSGSNNLQRFTPVQGHYNGCVMTFLSGHAKGRSTRIVGYNPLQLNGSSAEFWVDATSHTKDQSLFPSQGDATTPADQVLINGRPFSGVGFGYLRANGVAGATPYSEGASLNLTTSVRSLDGSRTLNNLPVALLPNHSLYAVDGILNASPLQRVDAGGADEPYDAPDYQNMALSYSVPTPGSSKDILPSFHRQDLMAYWFERLKTDLSPFGALSPRHQVEMFFFPYGRDFKRETNGDNQNPVPYTDFNLADRDVIVSLKSLVSSRPLREVHPGFTGSNPSTHFLPFRSNDPPPPPPPNNIAGPFDSVLPWQISWDVDTDGDNIRDSIWTDPGLPVKTDSQGRRYKAMAAIMVKDMGGRLNVNAHGFFSGIEIDSMLDGSFTNKVPSSIINKIGVGYGPADVDLASIFPNPSSNNEFLNLLNGRYGFNENRPGDNNTNDILSRLHSIGVRSIYPGDDYGGYYGSHPQVTGYSSTVSDYSGRPYHYQKNNTYGITENIDDPYELNLVGRDANDKPYTPQELERLLRFNDIDAYAAPSRLLDRASTTFNNRTNRNIVTTDSRQVPSLPVPPIPADLRGSHSMATTATAPMNENQIDRPLRFGSTPTIVDLARERIRRAYDDYIADTNNTNVIAKLDATHREVSEDTVSGILTTIMPWEVLRGEPMDLNRPFERPSSDGDPYEFPSEYGSELSPQFTNGFDQRWLLIYSVSKRPSDPGPAARDTRNRFLAGSSPFYAKQLYARHLFCLLMLLKDEDYKLPPFTAVTTETGASMPLAPAEANNRKELTIRKIAQWAANVVDYRDMDASMLAFEYDANPFDGWTVDGNPNTDESALPTDDPHYNPDRRIVWGAETPDLLISETLAFHDLRLKNTQYNTGTEKTLEDTNDMDDDLDQYRNPQGSLFVELLNTRNFRDNNTKQLTDLYIKNAGEWKLDLGKKAPQPGPGNNPNGAPVWRMVVTQYVQPGGSTPPDLNVTDQALQRANLVHFQPFDSDLADKDPARMNPLNPVYNNPPGASQPSDPLMKIDRMIWFTRGALYSNADKNFDVSRFNDISFINRETNNPYISANEHLVVGPRPRTYLGTKPLNDPILRDGINSRRGSQWIDLDPTTGAMGTGVSVTGIANSPTANLGKRSGMICTMLFDGWNKDPDELEDDPDTPTANFDIGLNVSEPLPNTSVFYNGATYYPRPPYKWGHYSEANPDDRQYAADGSLPASKVPDEPFDTRANYPLQEDGIFTGDGIGTHENYKAVLLQRLANPTVAYHAVYNPYVTVDWKPIDLQVFNGEDNPSTSTPAYEDDFNPGNGDNPNDGQLIKFTSRQAGRRTGDSSNGTPDMHLFGAFQDDLENRAQLQLSHWDAFDPGGNPTPWNSNFPPGAGPKDHFARPLRHTLGYSNSTFGARRSGQMGVDADYTGIPSTAPFAWLDHPNRPLISKFELLKVPGSAPQRLLYENTMFKTLGKQYGDDNEDLVDSVSRFGGLLNFFHSGTSPTTDDERRSHFYRLFDYVSVPSKFVGSYKYYKADLYNTNAYSGTNDLRKHFRFPFSRRSEFRDPGVINLNTIASAEVFKAIYSDEYWNTGSSLTNYVEIFDSMSGHSAGDYSAAARDYPSWFANPFRPSGVAEMAPPLEANQATAASKILRVSGVDSTPLRSRALFDGTGVGGTGEDEPLFGFKSTDNYRDTDKNPMYRYQGIQRLGNLTGYQSNVYAVWVTIGYFEVTPTPVSAAIPDGWQLGAELGLDTGDINRHRGFYIMDRSIPVGYEPGEDHNTDDAILVRRFVE